MTNTSRIKHGKLSKDNCMSAENSSTEFRKDNDTANEVLSFLRNFYEVF